jgi:ABC-2 type transport system permease protein
VTATSAPVDEGRVAPLGGVGRTWPVVAQLARRSIVLVTRLPSAFIPSVIFPIFLIISFSGSFNGLSRVAFNNAMSWYAPLAFIQGAAFVGVGAGFAATREIETGFYDRLLLAPTPHRALLLGPALASVVRSILPFTMVVIVAVIGGAALPSGAVGLLTLFTAAAGTCLIHSFWTLGLAYRFKSQRAAPIMQIGVFVTNFLATAQVPLQLMTGWLHSVARVNPMTNVFRLGRAGWINDATWGNCWGGLLAIAVCTLLAALFAYRSLQRMIP